MKKLRPFTYLPQIDELVDGARGLKYKVLDIEATEGDADFRMVVEEVRRVVLAIEELGDDRVKLIVAGEGDLNPGSFFHANRHRLNEAFLAAAVPQSCADGRTRVSLTLSQIDKLAG